MGEEGSIRHLLNWSVAGLVAGLVALSVALLVVPLVAPLVAPLVTRLVGVGLFQRMCFSGRYMVHAVTINNCLGAS
jgi:hypothetical protein